MTRPEEDFNRWVGVNYLGPPMVQHPGYDV